MSVADNTIPIRLQRQLARICVRDGCGVSTAQTDSDECPRCDEDSKKRKRKSAKKRRAELREKNRCIDCRRKTKGQQRCRRCWRRSRGKPKGVDKAPEGVDKKQIWRVDPGTTWNRFRGKGRRGRLTREEQAEEDKRDARFAIAEVEKFIAAIDVVISPAVQALSKIQRDTAKREAAQYLGTAGRFLDDLMDRYGAEVDQD